MWLLLLAGMSEAFLPRHMKCSRNLHLRKAKAPAPPSHRPLRLIRASQGLTVFRTFLGRWKIPNGTGWAGELLGGRWGREGLGGTQGRWQLRGQGPDAVLAEAVTLSPSSAI